VAFDQTPDSKALAATFTARSTSAFSPLATLVITEPSLGASVSNLLPEAAGTNLPSMNMLFFGFSAAAFLIQAEEVATLDTYL
jgi:hypothetical protein